MSEQLKPLSAVLDNVLARLACVEAKLGVAPSPMSTAAAVVVADDDIANDQQLHPRLSAFDTHITNSLLPFTSACNSLGNEMGTIGTSIHSIWKTMRDIIELGTTYKKPFDPDNTSSFLQPHLKPCQDAMASIRSARLDRKFDYHIKAIMEMLSCVSWVVVVSPPSPSIFVKDTIGASDFWANKIRKEYKDKTGDVEGESHVKFCDTMKAMVLDLSAYLKEHHLSGLAWNPNGKEDFASAKVGGSSNCSKSSGGASSASSVTPKGSGVAGAGASSAGDIFAELKKKQTGDGSSAATGLKKVTKDQQTWRKEYKSDEPPLSSKLATLASPPAAATASLSAKGKLGPPKCEYQERGCKWNVENQTKDNCEGGVCKVTVTDAKQQVYIYKCQNVTIQITGKLKSVIVDSCTKVGVVFDTAISACEIVNCNSVQVQSTNLCPSFSIDKTDGIVVHLTNEAVSQSVFVTSKSSEMNGECDIDLFVICYARCCMLDGL
jgi:adenylyl cyclase-associated protein